jgi:hypothetical protein
MDYFNSVPVTARKNYLYQLFCCKDDSYNGARDSVVGWHYSTTRKVAGSIHDRSFFIFN